MENKMHKVYALMFMAAVLPGCIGFLAPKREPIEWPDEAATQLLVSPVEAGAGLAAAAAIREMVKNNPHPDLFRGCTSPEQGLDVSVFKDPKSGLYFVVISQHFSRCGGPRVRVLDGWYEYAVTPQGEVVGEAPPLAAEEAIPGNEKDSPAPSPAITPQPDSEASTEGAVNPSAPPAQPLQTVPPSDPAPVPAGR